MCSLPLVCGMGVFVCTCVDTNVSWSQISASSHAVIVKKRIHQATCASILGGIFMPSVTQKSQKHNLFFISMTFGQLGKEKFYWLLFVPHKCCLCQQHIRHFVCFCLPWCIYQTPNRVRKKGNRRSQSFQLKKYQLMDDSSFHLPRNMTAFTVTKLVNW